MKKRTNSFPIYQMILNSTLPLKKSICGGSSLCYTHRNREQWHQIGRQLESVLLITVTLPPLNKYIYFLIINDVLLKKEYVKFLIMNMKQPKNYNELWTELRENLKSMKELLWVKLHAWDQENRVRKNRVSKSKSVVAVSSKVRLFRPSASSITAQDSI